MSALIYSIKLSLDLSSFNDILFDTVSLKAEGKKSSIKSNRFN